MHALSEQFLLLDKMRASAGVKRKDWARKAGILWLRFLQIFVEGSPPEHQEIANLKRALEELAGVSA